MFTDIFNTLPSLPRSMLRYTYCQGKRTEIRKNGGKKSGVRDGKDVMQKGVMQLKTLCNWNVHILPRIDPRTSQNAEHLAAKLIYTYMYKCNDLFT